MPDSALLRVIVRCRRTVTLPVLGFALLSVAGTPGDARAQRSTTELSRAPAFTPMTARPRILNEPEIMRAIVEAYPPVLRDAGIGGTVTVFFFIDETGRVANKLIDRSSGHQQLDQAALDVANVYRFAPAMNREQAVPVWIIFPITFRVGGVATEPTREIRTGEPAGADTFRKRPG